MKSITNLAFIVLLISSSNTSSAFIPSVSAITPSTNNKSTSLKEPITPSTNNKSTSLKEPHTISSSTTKQLLQQQQQRKTTALNMGSQGLVYGTAIATTFCMQLIGFVAAYALKTEKFYDIFGGLNYLILALLSAILGATGDGALQWIDDPRKILVTILFGVSRGWLLMFLAWRAHERKGDSRFDEVLGKNGGTPQPGNFLVYWMAQAFWVMLVSMPMLFVNSSNVVKPDFSAYDIVMAVLIGISVLTEIVADIQKAIWVKNGRQGNFCEVGVWKYSRHPNYFGEIFQWWCLWAFSYSSSQNPLGGYADSLWWAGIVSPLFSMQILLNMAPTGIMNAEGKNLKRYYDKCPERYAKYRKNTSILIPFIGYGFVPQFLKRTIFFDFEKYEYKPRNSSADDASEAITKKEETEGIRDYGTSGEDVKV